MNSYSVTPPPHTHTHTIFKITHGQYYYHSYEIETSLQLPIFEIQHTVTATAW